MLKKDIAYKNPFTGEDEVETAYFHISERELVRLDADHNGNLMKYLTNLQAGENTKEVVDFFEKFLLMAYGVRSDDGKRHIKTPEVVEAFTQTEAWNVLFMEMATDGEAMLNFFIAVMPENMRENIINEAKKQGKTVTQLVTDAPKPPTAPVPPAS